MNEIIHIYSKSSIGAPKSYIREFTERMFKEFDQNLKKTNNKI